MRRLAFPLILFAAASPAVAAPETGAIEQALRDPATAERIDRSIGALTDALLDLKVGELQAAIEGRQPSAADRALTVRELERRNGRDAEAIRRQVREAGPAIARGMNALAEALPALTRALTDVEKVVERAAANMPDPNYPKR
jgi:hypothetical protein